MKTILACLAVASATSASKIYDHEGTFYQEYNVGGHAHERKVGDDEYVEPTLAPPPLYPSRPDRPDLFADDDEEVLESGAFSPHYRSTSHRTNKFSLDIPDDEVAKLYN